MDKVARLPAEDRAALFGESGANRGIANTIIEKDFWVCWTLKRLFGLREGEAATLVFKGGTPFPKRSAPSAAFLKISNLRPGRPWLYGGSGSRAGRN